MTRRCFLLLCVLALLPASAAAAGTDTCAVVPIAPERLPDLCIPRSGHSIFYADGELTVAGGHTTNFVPTPTAERYADGAWHTMPMAYSHDNGFAVTLADGDVIIGGGHEEPLGIGQTFTLERYSPQTHTFEGFGCLDHRRVLASATLMADGRVVISGNHYADDAIAIYDGQPQVQHLKTVRQGRSNPYILPIGGGDALIIGSSGSYDQTHDTVWADRLRGDAFRVPLLEQWHPIYIDQPFSSEISKMGDAAVGADAASLTPDPVGADASSVGSRNRRFQRREVAPDAYLLAAIDSTGQMGFVVVRDTSFTLLPTACPVPMQSQYGPIFYKSPAVCDQQRQRAYVVGVDSLYRHQYVLAIDYARQPAALTLYQTDALEHAAVATAIVSPQGDLILAGGSPDNNYKTLATVWLYHASLFDVGTDLVSVRKQQAHADGHKVRPYDGAWPWVLLGIIAIAAVLLLIIYIRRKRVETPYCDVSDDKAKKEELLQRLCQYLELGQRYLQSPLRLSDIAVELGVSVSTITDSLSTQRGITFAQLIAEYRVHHAQRLLADNPDMKLAAVISQAGFTSESTFFRTFKAVTGLSPKEWLAQQ